MATNAKELKITQRRSINGQDERMRDTLHSLGLGRIGKVCVHKNNSSLMGKLKRIEHLVYIQEVK